MQFRLVARLLAGVLFFPGLVFAEGNQTVTSFAQARRLVFEIARDNPRTLYCNCAFKDKQVDAASCGYVPARDSVRARRVEIEHVVPAENFGRSFVEWREGHDECVRPGGRPYRGRRCAQKINATYRLMESDLYNLYPEIGELNADRSNYRYGMIEGEERRYGSCDFEVEDRVAEPRPEIRGDIARIYFYMDWAYPGHGIVGKKSRQLFEAWDKEDPVDAAECARARRVEQVQGNANPFVKEACSNAGLLP
ncbi:MAG: endonuclease [Spirochaetota bacterium]